MIKTLQGIKISGGGINFASKLIYNASYNPSFASPSSLSLYLIDEDGNYNDVFGNVSNSTPLSLTNSYTITFPGDNGLKFTGFPVEAELENSPTSGKILRLLFNDASIILDRLQIGLSGRTENVSGMLLLGEPVNPCKNLEDLNESPDPCDPCYKRFVDAKKKSGSQIDIDNFEERKKQLIKECEEELSISIRDVTYNFRDFLSALGSKGLMKKYPSSYYDKYKVRYTGSARQVLDNFCADLGYTYYWNDGIVLVDISNGITPVYPTDDTMKEIGMTEQTIRKSLLDTKATAVTYFYGRQGEFKEYDCSKYFAYDYLVGLTPANFQTIFKSYKGNLELEEYFIYCCLARYNNAAADLYLFSDFYNIKSANDLQAMRGKKLPALGMEILAVAGPNLNQIQFNAIKQRIPTEQQEVVNKFLGKDGYFFIATTDEVYATAFFDMASKIGNEFLGRYFYARTTVPDFTNIEVPYGSLNEFSHAKGDEAALKNLFGQFLDESITSSDNDFVNFVENFNKGLYNRILVVDQEPSWYPADISDWKTTNFVFTKLGSADFLAQMAASSGITLKENTFIYMARPIDFSVTLGDGQHPNFTVTKDELGLRSDYCPKLTIKTETDQFGKEEFIMYAPPTSWNHAARHSKGFVVRMSYERNTKNVNEIKIKPIEVAITKGGSNNSCMGFEHIERDLSSLDFEFLLTGAISKFEEEVKVQGQKIDYECLLNSSKIREFILAGMDIAAYQSPSYYHSKSYKIAGIYTQNLSIANGLQNLNVSITDNGPETTFTLGNAAAIPLNPDMMYNTMEASLSQMRIKALGKR